MPYATLHLIGPEQSPETKTRLQTGMTDILVNILDAARPLVAIRIVEEPADNWSVGGSPLHLTEGVSGVLAEVTLAESAATDAQIAIGAGAISALLKEVLGANALPPYVVFERIGDSDWGYKGRTIAQIKEAARSKAA